MSDIRAKWEDAVLASNLALGLVKTCWAIRAFADRNGECFPSQSTLAKKRNCCTKTVRRHLVKLESLGYVDRAKGRGQTGIGGTTDLLTLTVPERPDINVVPTLKSGDKTKDGTNPDLSADTKFESGDKCDQKTGQHECPPNQRPSLNHPTSAPLCDAQGNRKMKKHEAKASTLTDAQIDELGRLLTVHQASSEPAAEYRARVLDASRKHFKAREQR